jgi:TPR repeat protein
VARNANENKVRMGAAALAGVMLAGIYMERGAGNSDDERKALECMDIASALGSGEASGFVGTAHETGKDGAVVVDKEKAFSYFKLGAQQGNAVAQFFAALSCINLLKDVQQEVTYLKMAAEQDYADAQFHLALHYIQRGGAWIKAPTWRVAGVHMLRRAVAHSSSTGGASRKQPTGLFEALGRGDVSRLLSLWHPGHLLVGWYTWWCFFSWCWCWS